MVGEGRVPLGLGAIFLRGTGFYSSYFPVLGIAPLNETWIIHFSWSPQFSVESSGLCFYISGCDCSLPFLFISIPIFNFRAFLEIKRDKRMSLFLYFLVNLEY